MALQRYNHTIRKLLDGTVTIANMKAMLLSSSASFDATHTTVNQVSNTGGYEVSGNGWDSGGEAVANAAWSTVDTDDAMLDADNLSVTATGGNIGPASAALLLVGTVPLFYQAFGSPQTAGSGTPFLLSINANGICRVTGS